MCVFKEQHYGHLLDARIGDFLSEYTSMDDVNRAASETSVSYSLLKQVRSRNQPMSQKSAKGITRLMEIAVENCGNIAKQAKVDQRKIKKLLKV